MQSAARLKIISAKHLATTGQSVNLLVALLPHIRASLLSQLPSKHHMLLSDLERVSQELIDHHGQIVDKFVSIVSDFIEASAKRLRLVDWDRLHGPCEYFEEVAHNVSSLHRVLLTCLPSEQISDIFGRIFALLNRTIPAHFVEVLPNTLAGRQRIMDEISHLVTSFSRLKQVDSSQLAALEEVFKTKYCAK
jgi:vacuolar protein sorting-associated protein 54